MELEPFALERFQSIWENRVAWNLAESGVHPLKVAELADTDALRDSLLRVHLGYPQTNGTIELRRLIADIYPGATPEHVEVTNGGSEANCVLLLRLIQPGHSIVFMTPNYMQAWGFARALGADVRRWPLREDQARHRWLGDVDELRSLVTPNTRAILLCTPNNPTGARLDASMLDHICLIASSVGAWVISDEIYRGAEREADDTPSIWGRYERAVVSSGLSKAYGLPGLRIGWIVAPPSLVEDLWAVHDYTTIAPGAISDCLARVALSPDRRSQLLARTRGIIRSNYALLREWLAAHEGLTHLAPEAGAIAFVRYAYPIDSVTLTSRLRDEHGVLVAAGAHFGLEGYVRIGFGSDRAHLSHALALTSEFLNSLSTHAR